VDWQIILDAEAPAPAMSSRPVQEDLGWLLAAFDELAAIADRDVIVRRGVEIALEHIGLERVGVFLLDEAENLMLGTWGTDLERHIVDEHHLMYEMGDNDREVFRRAAEEGVPFTVFENCPIVVQREAETVVVGRGWVASTPIRSARARIGMLFNDTGLSGNPVDEAKQARAAILCSLLGALLDDEHDGVKKRLRDHEGSSAPKPLLLDSEHLARPMSRAPGPHLMVREAMRLLARDPTLGGKEIADKLDISLSRLARVFKVETGTSLVDYRNRLRLERFGALVDSGRDNLLEAALAAGFGSYAQFHRVFRAVRGASPREYLRKRGSN
jgi:AraC-like DNA-binding protein